MMRIVSMSPPKVSVLWLGHSAPATSLSRALSVSATLSTLSLMLALPRSTLPSLLRLRSSARLPAA
jgi:hypothetical protein